MIARPAERATERAATRPGRSAGPTALRGFVAGTSSNRLLRFGLLVIALVPTAIAFYDLATVQGRGIDLEIPLRAAERWVNGGQPYLASSFQAPPGPDLPFLYPPFVLPFLTPLLALPRELVLDTWVLVCLAGAVWGLRRLGVPYRWTPLLLISPPFAEGIIGGNVQILLFAAFAALFFRRVDAEPAFHPVERDPTDPATPTAREGLLATTIAALKVSELHAWAYLLFRRPRAALLGLAALVVLVLLTLPFAGIADWVDWVAQVRRAADPNWRIGGMSLGHYLPQVVAYGIAGLSVLALWRVPRRAAGTWVGVLSVVGAPSLHIFGLLFMLPAWLRIRRELGLVAAFFIGWFTEPGVWAGIAIVAVAWTLGATRWPWLLEPRPVDAVDAGGQPSAAASPEPAPAAG